jgi:hypothetical protein
VVKIGDVALSLDSSRYSTFTHASMPRSYILESRVRTSLHPAALHTTLAKGQENLIRPAKALRCTYTPATDDYSHQADSAVKCEDLTLDPDRAMYCIT